MFFNDKYLSSATGFVVKDSEDTPLLITNWHVVSGRHAETISLSIKKTVGYQTKYVFDITPINLDRQTFEKKRYIHLMTSHDGWNIP